MPTNLCALLTTVGTAYPTNDAIDLKTNQGQTWLQRPRRMIGLQGLFARLPQLHNRNAFDDHENVG